MTSYLTSDLTRDSLIDPDLQDELIALARRRLAQSVERRNVAAVEARWIAQHAVVHAAHGEQARVDMHSMVTRRLAGEPLSRIFGKAEFYGISFGLNEATLDPRGDTEALVNLILDHFPKDDTAMRVLDLGTGTGCIPISLLSERDCWSALGVDLSARAVEQAKENANNLCLKGVHLAQRLDFQVSDWFSTLESNQSFDLITSNPPYLTTNELEILDSSVKDFDPTLALDGGFDGLDCYRLIFKGSRKFLNLSGYLALEMGWKQQEAVCKMAMGHGFEFIAARQDLGGRDRALLFRLSN